MDDKKKSIVVVLGMHRSGTSAITRGLQVMGVELGDKLIAPIEGNNAKGFWEDIDLAYLNVEMLNAIGSDWYHLAPLEAIDVEILCKQGYFLRAVELLRQKVSNVPLFGFKDPRVAKLLPFWKGVFSHCQFDVSYVIALRHPLSVVKSLVKRDGIEAERSYFLWLDHVLTSLTGSMGEKCVLVDYDRLMQSPNYELNRIAKCFDVEIDSQSLQSYTTEFLDQKLRHTVFDLNDLSLDATCPPIVREVYTALLNIASDKTKIDDVVLQNKIDCWVVEFERIKSLLLLVDKILIQQSVAKQTSDAQIASLIEIVANHESNIQRLIKSRSWRITKPLRRIVRMLRILRGD